MSFDTLKFKMAKELLAEATGILDEGEFWFKKVPFTFDKEFLYGEFRFKEEQLLVSLKSYLIFV